MFLLGGAAITWSKRKQSSVGLSTVEAGYMALSVATQEAIWLRQLQEELGMKEAGPTLIYEDNQGAISMARTRYSTSECRYTRGHMAPSATRRAWNERSRTDSDLRTQSGCNFDGKNPVFHKRTKHIQIRYHFVREAVEEGTIALEYCRTSEMYADSFTKALPREQFERLRIGIGLF